MKDMQHGDIDRTIISSHGPSGGSASLDVSQPNVAFIVGGRPRFGEETAELLRGRLTALTLVLTVTLSAAFVGNSLQGTTTALWFRIATLVVLSGCLIRLRSGRCLRLRHLRLIELIVFGFVVAQVSLMFGVRIVELAGEHDVTSVVGIKYLYHAAWCVLILIYGIFMPNTWRRGAAIMLPLACLPYLILAWQQWWFPDLAAILGDSKSLSAIPLPVVAAVVGVYGTHIINSARREAFKARQFGQYRLLEKLGSGGMGEVYKAEHVLLKRPCAMKLIKPGSHTNVKAITNFEKEVKATSKLTHWNTIEIYDYGHTEDGTFYYVMELLPGLSLEELVATYGALPPSRVVHLLRQVCGALQEAHGVGLIHRDIKPANIFAAQRGGIFDVAKLLDFGLVKESSHAQGPDAAAGNNAFSGTPLYMAPEQATAYDDVDGRADIYAIGAVAYHLLTGQPPFSGMSISQLISAHAKIDVAPPTTVNANLPADVERVVLKCLRKQPADRFPDAASLARALQSCDCATDWTSDEAAHWWANHRASQKPADQAGKQTIDVTIDVTTSDASSDTEVN